YLHANILKGARHTGGGNLAKNGRGGANIPAGAPPPAVRRLMRTGSNHATRVSPRAAPVTTFRRVIIARSAPRAASTHERAERIADGAVRPCQGRRKGEVEDDGRKRCGRAHGRRHCRGRSAWGL